MKSGKAVFLRKCFSYTSNILNCVRVVRLPSSAVIARKNKRKEKELLRIISSDWPLRKLRQENTRTNVMSHGLALK